MKPSLALLVGGLLCPLSFAQVGAANAQADSQTRSARVIAAPGAAEPAGARADGREGRGPDTRSPAPPAVPASGPGADTGLLLAGLALMVGIALRRPGR